MGYLNNTGLAYFWGKIKAAFGSTLTVSGRTVTLKSKSGATLSTITTQDTTYSTATSSANGLMSSTDKSKLDGIATGATANTGTITGIKMNGTSKGTSGVVDLGTVITSHQDISGKANLSGATFTGNITAPITSTFSTNANGRYRPDETYISGSPMGGTMIWHDLFAFCKTETPKTYRTTDGSTWTETTTNKNFFAQKGMWSTEILNDTYCGYRFYWSSGEFAWGCGSWLVLGMAYVATIANYTVLFETSADGTTWTTRHSSTGNQQTAPIYCKVTNYNGDHYHRLSITKAKTDSGKLNMGQVRLLSPRYGSQGKGIEIEYPYTWDADQKLTFKAASINGVTVPDSPKFTDTTYSVATTSANGLMSSGDKTKLNGVATGATKNSITTATVTLTVAGWSNKSQTVSVTGITASNLVIVNVNDTSNGITCTSQGTGILTFTCESVPTTSVTASIAILS